MRPVVYVGYDSREVTAYKTCVWSLLHHQPDAIVQPISRQLLGGLYRRPTEKRGGILYDVISDAPMATDFALARFWAPYLHQTGWLVFCDVDFLWRAPVERLLAFADDHYAVMVVKHEQPESGATKMDGQVQTHYARKNWSSLMLMNCDRLLEGIPLWLEMCNKNSGLSLHQFKMIPESRIGELPLEWNWLEGISPHVDNPQAVHFTRGTPDLRGYEDSAYADEWRHYAARGPA